MSHSGKLIRSYTVEFKLKAVETLRSDPDHNISATAKKFSVDRRRIREWDQSYDKLVQALYGRMKKKRKLHCGAAVASHNLDIGVFEYLEDERSEGRAVSNRDLQEKARELADSMGLVGFTASRMWLWRWKKRWNVGRRRSTNCSLVRIHAM